MTNNNGANKIPLAQRNYLRQSVDDDPEFLEYLEGTDGVPIQLVDPDGRKLLREWCLTDYTMIPNYIIDRKLPFLSGTELKVLLYILRRTLGFRKSGDLISLSQFQNGIVKRDGTALDHGTGVRSRKAILDAAKGLEACGLIYILPRRGPKGENRETLYFACHPRFEHLMWELGYFCWPSRKEP